ncbi:interferon regulatory factor 7 isoform X2 [Heliangelus exortis]|uniref:interferon regulatory factor 7 isoform X2 n=1 Tax=Heliangelus exortis TaxID=472823 RepID=UPI003A925F61
MAALQRDGETKRVRFGPWLLSAVNSGNYRGLCWTDPDRRAFRVPWKHNARRDVTDSDLEVFKAWAQASGRYEGCPEDPAKWKTNFRCALRSTRMFVMLENNSRCEDDPHKVFAVAPAALWHGEQGDFSRPDPAVNQQLKMELNPEAVAPEMVPTGSTNPTQSLMPEDLNDLEWELKQWDISCDADSLTPLVPADVPVLQSHSVFSQNNCPPLPAGQQWEPVAEQLHLDTYNPPGMQGDTPLLCCPPDGMLSPDMMLPAPVASPRPAPQLLEDNMDDGIIPNLDVSIYYRGKLFHREEVRDRQCLLVYQTCDPAVVELPGHLLCFPSPQQLPDHKQRGYTEKLLLNAGLHLKQRARKVFATRLKKCKVFWALSQQLEGAGDPPPNLLCRDKETPIFDFDEFCTELRDFRNSQRKQSPDFTIYLCFGQSFSSSKPKESKLVLVKLVPKFCEYWHEQVLREGASSLDSATVSLQLSDSFSLFELIEQFKMQTE